jgi:hypothetical protein
VKKGKWRQARETLGRKEDHVEGLGGDKRKLLKLILRVWTGQESVADIAEYDNELSASIKGRKYFD